MRSAGNMSRDKRTQKIRKFQPDNLTVEILIPRSLVILFDCNCNCIPHYFRTECFCGENHPPSASKLADSSCNMKCPGNPKQLCGGYFTMNVFQTGITSNLFYNHHCLFTYLRGQFLPTIPDLQLE